MNFNELQDEFKISKMPLREALNKLSIEGFIEVKPRSGSYVAIPSNKDIMEMYDLRKAIEWQAVQLAIEHLPDSELSKLEEEIKYAELMIGKGAYHHFFQSDANFHGTILKYCDNSRIQYAAQTIDSHMKWFRVVTATTEERMYNSSRRHMQILEALFDRNPNIARDLMELHIEEVKIDMLNDAYQANLLRK